MDLLPDYNRQRLYITNSGMNRIEVFDMRTQRLLTPIKTGQLPHNMAFGTDGNTLYVANTGGESISIIDLTLGKIVDSVRFPPVPLNATTAIITPQAMASSLRGPIVIMSDGTLWKIDGNQALPRSLNQVVFGSGAKTIPAGNGATAFRTMASTPEGQYVIVFAGNGNAYIYDAAADDFTIGKQIFTTMTGYLGPVSAGPRGQYYVVNGVVLNSSLTPIGNIPNSSTGANTGTTTGFPGLPGVTTTTTATRPTSAVTYVGANMYATFTTPVRTNAASAATDGGIIQVMDVMNGNTIASASALEGPASVVTGNSRVVIPGRTMALDSTGTNAYVLTVSGLSVIPLSPIAPNSRPNVSPNNGVVNLANLQPAIAPGEVVGVFGTNLASAATAPTTGTLPTILGGTCVTLNNVAIPLMATASGQINAQIPTTLAAGRYPLVVHSINNQATSLIPATVTVSKYAPAVFVDSNGRAAIYHQDGNPVTTDNPTTRDQHLTMLATGLGVTSGGKVTTGSPSPSNPLAVTAPVSVYFGNASYSQSGIVVEWSGLVPGMVGIYQLDLYVPGTHMKGNALPVMIKIGGVSSPVTGSMVPTVAID
jgi:uncharacterized protein (TIGR03437 family)